MLFAKQVLLAILLSSLMVQNARSSYLPPLNNGDNDDEAPRLNRRVIIEEIHEHGPKEMVHQVPVPPPSTNRATSGPASLTGGEPQHHTSSNRGYQPSERPWGADKMMLGPLPHDKMPSVAMNAKQAPHVKSRFGGRFGKAAGITAAVAAGGALTYYGAKKLRLFKRSEELLPDALDEKAA